MNFHWRLRDIRPVRLIMMVDLAEAAKPLGRLSSAIDTKHRYKAPLANRPGARPYERKKSK